MRPVSCAAMIDQPLEQEQRLGLAGAADRIDRHGVGEGAVEIEMDRGDAVEARDHLGEAGGRDGRREHRDIGAEVGLGLHPHAEEAAVGVERQLAGRDEIARMAVGQRMLGALARSSAGRASSLRVAQAIRVDSAEIGIFRPEAAADILGDQPQLLLRQCRARCSHISRCGICTPCEEKVTVTRSSAGVVGRPGRARLHVVHDLARRADRQRA